MTADASYDPAGTEFPQFFLVKTHRDDGAHYVVCHSILAVSEGALGGVRTAIDAEFERQAQEGARFEVCEIPDPREDGTTWMALQTKIQVSPPKR